MRVLDDWLLTSARAAIHLPTGTAVVADLHLGYRETRRQRGDAVPLVPLAAVLAPLQHTLARLGVSRLVVAGDLFEARPQESLLAEVRAWLAGAGVELVGLVPGNHDRGLTGAEELGPLCPEGMELGRWRIVHGDGELPPGPVVQGHEHPCLTLPGAPRAPCYLAGGEHLVLPAYSADAAGVNVLGAARWTAYRCGVVAGDTVLDFGTVGALPTGSR
jgi:putative SbcD/Mre11-related phosphoesterase